MLQAVGKPGRVFPPTTLYNEGWLLRLVIDWFSRRLGKSHSLAFSPGALWYSEALLPSRFLARHRGDPLAESRTHADGVLGHFTIGEFGVSDLRLDADANQFLITEAKLFSQLSPRVSKVRYFDQAARNVACLAEAVSIAGAQPDQFTSLGFVVLAPREQIDAGVFEQDTNKDSIREKVRRRVNEYNDEVQFEWFANRFLPAWDKARVECISWEEIIEHIKAEDSRSGDELSGFYAQCLRFNRRSKGGNQ